MSVILDTVITAIDGTPIEEKFTVGAACIQALTASLPNDEKLSGNAKVDLFKLACKIHGAEKADLTSEEISLIKDRVGRMYSAIVVGRVWQTLDPVSV